MPLGFRDGGMRLKHNFPVDGEYRFNILFPDQTLRSVLRGVSRRQRDRLLLSKDANHP